MACNLLLKGLDPADERTEAMLPETPSLLITDDDPGFRETLRVIFEPKGFRTLLAGDGDEALKIVHNETGPRGALGHAHAASLRGWRPCGC